MKMNSLFQKVASSVAFIALASLFCHAEPGMRDPGWRRENEDARRSARQREAQAEAAQHEAAHKAAMERNACEARRADRERLIKSLEDYKERMQREAARLDAAAREMDERYSGKHADAIQRQVKEAAQSLSDTAREGAEAEAEPTLETGNPTADALLNAQEIAERIGTASEVGQKSNELRRALDKQGQAVIDALDPDLAKQRDAARQQAEKSRTEARLAQERIDKAKAEKQAEQAEADRQAAEKARQEAEARQKRDKDANDKRVRDHWDRIERGIREGAAHEKFEKGIRNA